MSGNADHARRRYRLAVIQSHPIQYFVPFFRRLAQEPALDLTVYFCSCMGLDEYLDPGFGQRIKWDIPLLDGYRSIFLPNLRHTQQVNGFFSLMNLGLIRELRQNRFDALWVPGNNYFVYLLGVAAAKFQHIPLLMRCDAQLHQQRSTAKRLVRTPIMNLFYQLFDACLTIGTRNAEYYRFHHVPAERLFLAPYAVDNDWFIQSVETQRSQARVLRSELGVPADRPVILYVAKVVPNKRPMDLLRAYHRLRQQGLEAALVIVGSGSTEDALRHYVQAYQVPDVCLLGFRNQAELPKLYAMADIFVLPSQTEAWGLVVNEAMCAGLPVIATDSVGAVPDLVHHEYNGFVYPVGNVDLLTKHLADLVTDPERRRQMGTRSHALIADWNLDRCVQGVMLALDKVCSP